MPTLVIYDQIAQFDRKPNFPAESLAKLDVVLGADMALSTRRPEPASSSGSGPTSWARPTTPNLASSSSLGQAGTLGVIAPDAYADLLAVDGDPLADVEVLAGQGERLDLIVRAGEVIINRLG